MHNIKIIPDTEIFNYFHIIKEIPMNGDMTHETCLAKCLVNEFYSVLVGGECLVIYRLVSNKHVRIIGTHAPNLLKKHLDSFCDELKENGIERLSAISSADPKAYERLTGFECKYSYFERCL